MCFDVSQPEKENIAGQIVKLGRQQISNRHTQQFLKQEFNIMPYKLQMNGKIGWDSSIPILTNEYIGGKGWEKASKATDAPCSSPSTSSYECPKCMKVGSSSNNNFQANDLDKKQSDTIEGEAIPRKKVKESGPKLLPLAQCQQQADATEYVY